MDNFENNKPIYQEEDTLDIKGIIIKVLSYWYLFIIGIIVALVAGYLYNRYTPKVYQVSASLYIKQDKMTMDPTSMMTGLTFKSNINILIKSSNPSTEFRQFGRIITSIKYN